MTVATPIIHDGQRAKPPAIQSCISHKIPTPSLIHLARARGHDPQMTRPLSTAREPYGQPFFPVDPVHPLPIHHPAFAAKHDVQAEIAKARAGLGQLPQPHTNRGIVPPMVSVIPRRPIQPQQPTRSPHTDRELSGDGPHQRAFAWGRQAFFARTSCRMILSKVRSATNRFNRLFSSSSCRRRRISAMAIWP